MVSLVGLSVRVLSSIACVSIRLGTLKRIALAFEGVLVGV